jgi:transmembrane sensor
VAPSDPDQEKQAIADEAARWLVRMHSGRATAADREALAAWRARDPRHEAAYRDAERIWAAAGDLEIDRGTGRIKPASRKKPRKPLRSILIAVAAGLAAGALGFLAWPPSHDIMTATAEVKTVVLPDGSRATLNAKTALDLQFTQDARAISLAEGEAFFEVAADPRKPFQVTVAGTTVTALGTAFNVNTRGADNNVVVTVTEHAVQVTASRAGSQDVSRVGENQQAVVRDGLLAGIQPASREKVLSWQRGLLIAEGRPLSEVIEELRYHYPGWIVVANRGTGRLRVSAVLKLNDPVASLQALSQGLPIRVTRLSPYVTVVTPR